MEPIEFLKSFYGRLDFTTLFVSLVLNGIVLVAIQKALEHKYATALSRFQHSLEKGAATYSKVLDKTLPAIETGHKLVLHLSDSVKAYIETMRRISAVSKDANEQYSLITSAYFELQKEYAALENWIRENRIYLPQDLVKLMRDAIYASREVRFENEALINPEAAGHVQPKTLSRNEQIKVCVKMERELNILLDALVEECQKRLGLLE